MSQTTKKTETTPGQMIFGGIAVIVVALLFAGVIAGFITAMTTEYTMDDAMTDSGIVTQHYDKTTNTMVSNTGGGEKSNYENTKAMWTGVFMWGGIILGALVVLAGLGSYSKKK